MRIFVTPSQLAKELNLTRKSVYSAERNGRIAREQNGLFDLKDTRENWHRSIPLDRRREGHVPGELNKKEWMALGWEILWERTMGAFALLVRDRTGLSSEKVWQIVSTLFLIQWEELEDILEFESIEADRTGALGELMDAKRFKRLERWLDKKERVEE